MAEFQPALMAHRQQPQQQPGPAPSAGAGLSAVPDLPADVDLEEQRMLMAAIQGGGYQGELPGAWVGHGLPRSWHTGLGEGRAPTQL